MTFENFVKAVDQNVGNRYGVSVHDLPDIDFHGYWEDGEGNWDNQVREAASDALNRAGCTED